MRAPATTKLLFIVPAVLALAGTALFPFFFSVYMSLFNYNLFLPIKVSFQGMKNFIEIFHDTRALNSFKVTATFVALAVISESLLGLLLGYLIMGSFGNSPIITVLLLFPVMIPQATTGLLWRLIYQPLFGIANLFLSCVGLSPLAWLSHPKTALISIVIADVWQWTPFMILIAIAGLSVIPTEIFEAASIDGASGWRRFIYIACPLVWPIYSIGIAFRVIDCLRTFNLIFIMTKGGPGISTETVDIYAYLEGIAQGGRISYACALSLILLVLTVIFVTMILRKIRVGEG